MFQGLRLFKDVQAILNNPHMVFGFCYGVGPRHGFNSPFRVQIGMNLNGVFCFGWGLQFWLSFSQKQEQEEPHNDIHHDEHGAEFWRFRKKHDCVDDKPETEKEDPKAFQKLLHPATFYLISLWKATALPRMMI